MFYILEMNHSWNTYYLFSLLLKWLVSSNFNNNNDDKNLKYHLLRVPLCFLAVFLLFIYSLSGCFLFVFCLLLMSSLTVTPLYLLYHLIHWKRSAYFLFSSFRHLDSLVFNDISIEHFRDRHNWTDVFLLNIKNNHTILTHKHRHILVNIAH